MLRSTIRLGDALPGAPFDGVAESVAIEAEGSAREGEAVEGVLPHPATIADSTRTTVRRARMLLAPYQTM